MVSKAVESRLIFRTGIQKVLGEIRNHYVISTQDETDVRRAYTSENEKFRILRWESDGSIIDRDTMESIRGTTFGESWPFLKEMEQARKAQ